MVVCNGCAQSFPRITAENTRCGKCLSRKPGLSAPEMEALNSRPQCAGCGVASSLLSGLCNPCTKYYRSANSIPREFMANTRILELISSQPESDMGSGLQIPPPGAAENLSSTAHSILGSAVAHQENASESRIGLQVRKGSTKSFTNGGLTRFKNLQRSDTSAKGGSILAERKEKKTDWLKQQATSGPKIFAILYISRSVEDKPIAVNQIQCSRVYEPLTPMKSVLEDLLERLNSEFKCRLGVERDLLWSQITLFVQETATTAVSIEYLRKDDQLQTATAASWLKEFITHRCGTKANLQAGIIVLRFVVDEAVVPNVRNLQSSTSSLYSQHQTESSAKPSTTLISKRKRADSNFALTSKRSIAKISDSERDSDGFCQPGLPASYTSNTHLAPSTVTSKRSSRAPILRSQFRVPSSPWSREIALTNYQFTRSTAEYQPSGDVKISRANSLESIAIADDWLEGEEAWVSKDTDRNHDHHKTGFIGRGYTKRGIYARYNNKEYVITQPFDDYMTFYSVREVLISELKLLAQCDGIKKKFDEFISECGIRGVPRFYFNFEDSFYGEIEPLSASGHRTLPHVGFLATPLLPCGKFDDPVQKFTGSDNFGSASDNLTWAIHAFVHFAWVYSREQILFCDMQGTYDRKKIMCLIDPQAHTASPRNENTIYWDGGPKKIAAWKEQHLPTVLPVDLTTDALCHENWICNALELSKLEPDDPDSEEPTSASAAPLTVAEKSKIGYVLNTD